MAGRKDNIKALFTDARTRVIVLFTVVLLLLTVSIGYYKFKSPSLSVDAGASVSTGPGGIRSIPGSANQTAQYAFLQEKQNVEQAKLAAKKAAAQFQRWFAPRHSGMGFKQSVLKVVLAHWVLAR